MNLPWKFGLFYCAELRSFRRGCRALRWKEDNMLKLFNMTIVFFQLWAWRCVASKRQNTQRKTPDNLIETYPIIIKKLPHFRPEMGARGTPEPQKLSQISQVQPQIEFSTNFDQFLASFWEPWGTLGTTLTRPWPQLGTFFGVFLQSSFSVPFLHRFQMNFGKILGSIFVRNLFFFSNKLRSAR